MISPLVASHGEAWIRCADCVQKANRLVHGTFLTKLNGRPAAASFAGSRRQLIVRVSTSRGYEVVLPIDQHVRAHLRQRRKFGGGYNLDREWRAVGDLQIGDQLVLDDASATSRRGSQHEFEEGWLVGCIVGDGGHNPTKYPSYARFWGPYAKVRAKRAAAVVIRLDQSFFSPISFRGAHFNSHHDTWQVSSRRIDDFLDGLIEPATKAGTPLLETKNGAFVTGFLQGLFDTDGSAQGTTEKGVSVRLGQSDLERLKMVQRMLLMFGVVSTIYPDRRPAGTSILPNGHGGSKAYDVWAHHELVIAKSNLDMFQRRIGFSQPEKREKLRSSFLKRKRRLNQELFITNVISISTPFEDDVLLFETINDCPIVINGFIIKS